VPLWPLLISARWRRLPYSGITAQCFWFPAAGLVYSSSDLSALEQHSSILMLKRLAAALLKPPRVILMVFAALARLVRRAATAVKAEEAVVFAVRGLAIPADELI
jgi:TRAP-type C4-dicarboxylate transport system permease small subunit